MISKFKFYYLLKYFDAWRYYGNCIKRFNIVIYSYFRNVWLIWGISRLCECKLRDGKDNLAKSKVKTMIWTLHLCTIYVRKTKCLIMYQLCTRNIEWMFSTLFAESLMQFILNVYYKIQGNSMHKVLFLSLIVTQSVCMKLIFTIFVVKKLIYKLHRLRYSIQHLQTSYIDAKLNNANCIL